VPRGLCLSDLSRRNCDLCLGSVGVVFLEDEVVISRFFFCENGAFPHYKFPCSVSKSNLTELRRSWNPSCLCVVVQAERAAASLNAESPARM